jgi:hypothetical protein
MSITISCLSSSSKNIVLIIQNRKNCCELFGVKRLSCFALRVTDPLLRESLITKELKEFDNHVDSREKVEDHKYAEEVLFKTCYIKKWQVEINPK